MSWIETVAERDATGALAREYAAARGRAGGVAGIVSIMSPNPNVLRTVMRMYKAIMFGSSPLSRAQRELIATAVSRFNECHY